MKLIITCIVIISLILQVNSRCAKRKSRSNNLSVRVKSLDKNDYLGALLKVTDQFLSSSTRYWPEEVALRLCNTTYVPIGGVNYNIAMYPRGCCANCCPVNRVEKHLTLYFTTPNKHMIAIHLSNKHKSGKLTALGINNKLKTIIHLHGFAEDVLTGSGNETLNAYLDRKESYNIILLDYSPLSAMPWYSQAIDNLDLVAEAMAKFIIFYDKTGELPIENIHIIGLSLGAQLASQIGRLVSNYKKIPRITCLDPAYPLYSVDDSSLINKNDAEFVDIIHTDPGSYGFPTSLGHADFYIQYNNTPTPGCTIGDLMERNKLGHFFFCDHVRTALLYAMSVRNPHKFPVCSKGFKNSKNGTKCGYMGFMASKSTTVGDYYLIRNTNEWKTVS